MAQMQICLAATYRKYYTRVSPKTTDASMEVDDGISSAGPIVYHQIVILIYRVIIVSLSSMMRVICRQVLKQDLSNFDMIPNMCSGGGRIEHEIDNMQLQQLSHD
jgi:hypothetical protein